MGKKRVITGGSGAPDAQKTQAVSASKRRLLKGVVSVASTYNNTLVNVSDAQGNTVVWTSAGGMGFKGTKKSTPYAATIVAREAVERAKRLGLQEAAVVIRGIGPGRDAAIRGVAAAGIVITSISDDTPIPHNGTRPKKPRRV